MKTPRATYRLQLRPQFGFDEAAGVADYLRDLGVSHVYSSPYLQAAPGSTHGYDVVDHSRVNEELGGAGGHSRFCATLGDVGLGQVLDIVPNHMAITPENRWWHDVLENGPSSRFADYFDVDWDPPEAKLRDTVLMPILGDHYGRVLEAGELRVERDGGRFAVCYAEHRLPVAPRSLDLILTIAAATSRSDDLAFLAHAFPALPPATVTDPGARRTRHRDKEVLTRQLARLCDEQPAVADAVDAAVAQVNADHDLLDGLLDRQNYRLAYWRTAGQELDYRRFFDITTLAGLRAEDEHVFTDTHGLVLTWLGGGVLDGVRVDHPDGLRDPAGYLARLHDACPEAWIVVEKILEPGESLPPWPVAGTTGYDFLNRVTHVLVDPAGEAPLTDAYARFTGEPTDFGAVAHEKKHLIMREVLAADLSRLTQLFVAVCERHRRYRDFTRAELAEVLHETIACFPVYRTYVDPTVGPSPSDRAHLEAAVAAARRRRSDLDPELFDLLGRVLAADLRTTEAADLLLRFQQTTGPVMAKGVEDTAFYTYNRLVALNEVGGDPGRFGLDVESFHAALADAHDRWPAAMLSSSTHDTKRSEDVRARLVTLSEIPARFADAVDRWSAMNERYRTAGTPDRNLEWLLYQTLVGSHPLPAARAVAYAEKATKEAKAHTSWIDPNPAYDDAVRRFVEGVIGDADFQADLDAFVAPLVEPGMVNSLAAQLVKLTAPGVPDIYQGTELWDPSLVDPDNRRPVDFAKRRRLLAEVDGLDPAAAWARAAEGVPKLLVTRVALHLRADRPSAFAPGPGGVYRPLTVQGAAADHAIAFARGDEGGGDQVVTIVPRLPVGLAAAGGWRDTTVVLPPGRWRDVVGGAIVDGGAVSVAEVLGTFPVALLAAERE